EPLVVREVPANSRKPLFRSGPSYPGPVVSLDEARPGQGARADRYPGLGFKPGSVVYRQECWRRPGEVTGADQTHDRQERTQSPGSPMDAASRGPRADREN